jgi:hypothetical protein
MHEPNTKPNSHIVDAPPAVIEWIAKLQIAQLSAKKNVSNMMRINRVDWESLLINSDAVIVTVSVDYRLEIRA